MVPWNSSIVIEHLVGPQKPAIIDTACLFIFFNHQDKANQTPYNLVIELLRQLVSQQAEPSEQVRRFYSQCKLRTTLPNYIHFLGIFRKEIRRFSKVWLVIDALDECPAHAKENTREDFLEMIRQLPSTVRLLITSRERKHARCGLDPVHEVEIIPDDNDLRSYIRGQIQIHTSHNELLARADADNIIRSISQSAKGMFLLAHLHMNDIAAQRTDADLQSSLENLPSEVHETYAKAIQRIPPYDIPLAKLIFSWITFAMRPLTIEELWCALAAKEGVTNASIARSHMLEEGCLATVCAGLVIVDSKPPARLIRLVHPTAESYLRNYFDFGKAHSIIAATCLRYLLFEDVRLRIHDQKQILLRLQDLPFLRYAALHWGDHVRNAQDPETVSMALEFLDSKANLASAAQIMDFVEDGFVSALWMAAHFGLSTVIDQLLSTRPEMLTKTMYGETVMHAAADRGHLSAVDRLCSAANIEPDLNGNIGRTPLSLAAENGHHEVVERLLCSRKVNPDSETMSALFQGRTPLSWAAANGHRTTVSHLLSTGKVEVDSTIINGYYIGRTPLMWAAANGHADVVELLLERGKANPSLEDGDGRIALSWAAQNGHERVAELLLQTDRAGLEKQDIHKQRPVDLAYKNKHEAVVKLLLTYPNLDFKDEKGRTTLSYETEHGNTSLIKVLLDIGADPNAKNEEDRTYLTYAADKGNIEVAKLLLESGADQEAQCVDARTPLSYASEAGHEEMVQFLLAHGAHVDTPDRCGRTPLSYAAEAGHEAIVTSLITCDKAVDLDSQSTSGLFPGRTPLSWAASKGKTKVVDILLQMGADVNLRKDAPSLVPWGPVVWAALNEHEETVRLLLATGKVELKPKDQLFGRPAHEWAHDNGFVFI
ncbi:hypothetical protein N0V90_005039 [Kalmusia sp. IMI 367209]|nr:hypothetical protein N0V90_005039 [Kalmusia sp. IMI 367209]